jgi:hypothetical protein
MVPVVKVLPSGQVLVAAGWSNAALSTAEIFDPATSQFTPTASLSDAREDAIGASLPDGSVLICGGWSNADATLGSAEIYVISPGAAPSVGPSASPNSSAPSV